MNRQDKKELIAELKHLIELVREDKKVNILLGWSESKVDKNGLCEDKGSVMLVGGKQSIARQFRRLSVEVFKDIDIASEVLKCELEING